MILVSGANGQLASCIKERVKEVDYLFLTKAEFDLTNEVQMRSVLCTAQPTMIINCAAYTSVDLAESHPDLAMSINANGVGHLASLSKEFNIPLVHLSTDYVFDGLQSESYKEEDKPSPVSIYGKSKLEGELLLKKNCERGLIIRTSWLYSEHGKNFLKTMVQVANNKNESIGIVNDQFGCPTYAGDLASFIISLKPDQISHCETIHFSNTGHTTWFGFANEIFKNLNATIKVIPIGTDDYLAVALRPKNSRLCIQKLQNDWGYSPREWKVGVKNCLQKLS